MPGSRLAQQAHDCSQGGERGQKIGAGRKPQRGLALGRSHQEERPRGQRNPNREPDPTAERHDQGCTPRVKQEPRQGKRPFGPLPHPIEQPPQQHGQGSVVFAAVHVTHEGHERIGFQPRERKEQVVVAHEGGGDSKVPGHKAQEQRCREDDPCAHTKENVTTDR